MCLDAIAPRRVVRRYVALSLIVQLDSAVDRIAAIATASSQKQAVRRRTVPFLL